MKAYKGFNKDMTCRGFQYEEGKEFVHDGEVSLCNSGFHACEDPIDCFEYYDPANSVYHEVEMSGTLSKIDCDSKIASSEIKIGGRIDVLGIAKAHFEYVKERTNFENTDPKQSTAVDGGSAQAGDRGAAQAGDSGAAQAGYRGAAQAGKWGAAQAGDRGSATSRGSSSVGENGIACARCDKPRIRGGIGSVLVIAKESEESYDIVAWKAVVVDGVNIKADTWYTLIYGELVEDDGEE